MNRYKQLRAAITLFVAAIVAIAVVRNSYLLAAAGVLTGIIFMVLVRAKVKISTDERELAIQEKAGYMTFAVFAPTVGIAAFFLLFPSRGGMAVFSKGEWLFIESLGMVFSYLALFLITIYAIFYHFFNQKLGGGRSEE